MHSATRARLSRRARARMTEEDGFTLIELLVAMTILLIVIASLASVLVSATGTEVDANNRFQAQEQASTGLTFLTRELHCAGSGSSTVPSITDTKRRHPDSRRRVQCHHRVSPLDVPDERRADAIRHLVHVAEHAHDRRLCALSGDRPGDGIPADL